MATDTQPLDWMQPEELVRARAHALTLLWQGPVREHPSAEELTALVAEIEAELSRREP
jgi:hypothetical protein